VICLPHRTYVNTQLQNLYGLAAKAILPLFPHIIVVSSERIARNE
jgi:hypothetical protein